MLPNGFTASSHAKSGSTCDTPLTTSPVTSASAFDCASGPLRSISDTSPTSTGTLVTPYVGTTPQYRLCRLANRPRSPSPRSNRGVTHTTSQLCATLAGQDGSSRMLLPLNCCTAVEVVAPVRSMSVFRPSESQPSPKMPLVPTRHFVIPAS